MKRGIGRLCGGEVTGLESLAELGEELVDWVLGRILGSSGVMVVVMLARKRRGLLEVILDVGIVLLGGGEIAGLQIL